MDGTTSRFSQDIQKSMSKSQFADQIGQVFRKKREEQVVGGEGIEKEIKTGTEFVGTAAMEFLGGEPGPATERMFMGQQPGDTRTLEQVVQQSKEFRQESEAYNPQAAIVTTSASQIAAGLRGLSMITNITDQPGQRYFESAMRGLQEGTASQADDVVSNITAAATSGVTSLGQTAAMGPFAMGSFFLQGMGSGASGYEQAYIAGTMGEDKDFSRGMQYVSGVLSGGIEVGTEHFGNVLELGIGKTAMGKVLGGTAKYGPGPQIAIALTKMSLVEGFVEEGPATLANYAKGRYITGEVDPNKKDWSDAFGDALVDSAYGSVGGAAGGGVSIPYGMYQAKKERDELTRRLVESNTEYADKDFWARVAPNTVKAMAPMSQAEREAEIEEAKKTVFQARADVEVMRQQFIDGDAKRVKAQAELKKAQKKKDQAAIDAAQQSFDDASTQIDDAKNKLAVLGADLLAAETRFEAAVAYTASRAPQITKTFDDVLNDEQATAAKPQTDADAMVAKELEGLGYDVVFYNDQNDKRDAFYSPFTPNTVYIRPGMNNETAGYVMGLGYHELLHDIQLTDSKLWSALRSAFDEESVIKAGVGYFQDMANAEDRMAVAAARASLAGDKTTGIDAIMRRHGNTLLTAEGTASELQDGIATLFRTGQAPGLLGRILARSGLRGRQAMTALKVRSILLAKAKERQKGQRSEFSAQVREAMASAAARKQLEAEYKQSQAKPAQAATTPQAASQATQAAQATQATQAQQPPSQAAPGAAAVPQAASATAATVSGMTPAQAAAARTPNFKATVDLAAERIRKKQPAWAKGVDLEDLVARNEDKALKKGLSPAERQIADKLQKEMKKQFGPEYRSMWSRRRGTGEQKNLVSDANGNPMAMYHGTNAMFDAFDDRSTRGDGIYFSSNREYAQGYGETKAQALGGKPRLLSQYLSMANPMVIDGENEQLREKYQTRGFDTAELERQGFDGILVKYADGEVEAMVIRPSQIVSIDGEKQTLDARSRLSFKSSLESSIEKMVADPKQAKAASPNTWLQRLNKLVNDGTVKEAEITWSGLRDWLEGGKSVLTPAQIMEYIREQRVYIDSNEDRSKWSQWTVFGGTSHTDILMTVPTRVEPRPTDEGLLRRGEIFEQYKPRLDELDRIIGDVANYNTDQRRSAIEERNRLEQERNQEADKEYRIPGKRLMDMEPFTKNHFQRANLVGHIRAAMHGTTMFVDEIQSDWAQLGRDRGFQKRRVSYEVYYETNSGQIVPVGYGPTQEAAMAAIDPGWKTVPDLELKVREVEQPPLDSEVLSGPFVESTSLWLTLALKQTLMTAVANGAERVAFISGTQANALYNLRNFVRTLSVQDRTTPPSQFGPQHTREITIIMDGREPMTVWVDAARNVVRQIGNENTYQLVGHPLSDVIGVEGADKMMSAPSGTTLKDEELEFGGDGNLEFYDSILPITLNKLLRKIGGKSYIREYKPPHRPGASYFAGGRGAVFYPTVDGVKVGDAAYQTEEAATKAASRRIMSSQVTVDITPELKKAVEGGLPLFARNRAKAEASYKALDSRRRYAINRNPLVQLPKMEISKDYNAKNGMGQLLFKFRVAPEHAPFVHTLIYEIGPGTFRSGNKVAIAFIKAHRTEHKLLEDLATELDALPSLDDIAYSSADDKVNLQREAMRLFASGNMDEATALVERLLTNAAAEIILQNTLLDLDSHIHASVHANRSDLLQIPMSTSADTGPLLSPSFASNETVQRLVQSIAAEAMKFDRAANVQSSMDKLLEWIVSTHQEQYRRLTTITKTMDANGGQATAEFFHGSQGIVGEDSPVALSGTRDDMDDAEDFRLRLRVMTVLKQLAAGNKREWTPAKFMELMGRENIGIDQLIAVGVYDYIKDNKENKVELDVLQSLAVAPTLKIIENYDNYEDYHAFPDPEDGSQHTRLYIDPRSTFKEGHFGKGVVYFAQVQNYTDNDTWFAITNIQSQLARNLGKGKTGAAGAESISVKSFEFADVAAAVEIMVSRQRDGSFVLVDGNDSSVLVNFSYMDTRQSIAPMVPVTDGGSGVVDATNPRLVQMSSYVVLSEDPGATQEERASRQGQIEQAVHAIQAIARMGIGRTIPQFDPFDSPGIKRYRKGVPEASKGWIEVVLSELIDRAVQNGKKALVLASPESVSEIHMMPFKAAEAYYGEGGYIDSILKSKFGLQFWGYQEIEDVQEDDPDSVLGMDDWIDAGNWFDSDLESGAVYRSRQQNSTQADTIVSSLFDPTGYGSIASVRNDNDSPRSGSRGMRYLQELLNGSRYGIQVGPRFGNIVVDAMNEQPQGSPEAVEASKSDLSSGKFVFGKTIRDPNNPNRVVSISDLIEMALEEISMSDSKGFDTNQMDYGRSEDDLVVEFRNFTPQQLDQMSRIVAKYGAQPVIDPRPVPGVSNASLAEVRDAVADMTRKDASSSPQEKQPLQGVALRLSRFSPSPQSFYQALTRIIQQIEPGFEMQNIRDGYHKYRMMYSEGTDDSGNTIIRFINTPVGLLQKIVEENGARLDAALQGLRAIDADLRSKDGTRIVGLEVLDEEVLESYRSTKDLGVDVETNTGAVGITMSRESLDEYGEFLEEMSGHKPGGFSPDFFSLIPDTGDSFYDLVTELPDERATITITAARSIVPPHGITPAKNFHRFAVTLKYLDNTANEVRLTKYLTPSELQSMMRLAANLPSAAQQEIYEYLEQRDNEKQEAFDEWLSNQEPATKSLHDDKYLNKRHRVYKFSPEWIAARKELISKRENWTMSARRREALNETVGMVPQSLRNLQRARLLYDAARKSGNEQVIKAAKKELRSAIRELTAAKSMSREGFAYNMGRREGRLAGEVRGQRKGRKEGRDQEAEVAKAKRIQMRAAFRNKVAALTDRINREVERNDALRDKMARVRRLNALGKADLAERLEKKVLKAWFAGQAKGSVAGAAAMKNEMVALRKDAVAMISMLPPSMRGKYLDAVARMRTPSGVAAVSKRVVQDMAQAEAKETVADLLRLRKRVKKVGLREDTRNSILGAVANGLAMLTSGGKRLLPYTDVADLSNRVAAANMMLEQARNDYDLEREEYRDLRDDRKEEAALDAQAFTATLSTLPSRPDSRISTEAPEESSWSKWASRFRSSDWYTLAEMIEGTYGGVMGKMWNSIKAGRNSMIADRRRIDGLIEQAYRNAGYAGYDGYISRAVGIYGSSSADVVSRVVGGRARTMTVDQMLHLAALDEDTVRLLRDSNDPTQEAAAPIVFSTYPNENPIPVTVQEIRSIQAALTPQQAALIAELKRIISDEVGPRAMEIYFQLNGRQPNSIPGYLPRQRLGIEIQEVTDVNGTAAQAINSMLANAGFGEERVQSKSTLVIGGLGRIIDSHVDESLRLIHLSMPLRYAVNVMKARGVRSNIDRAIGGGSHAAMMKMVYNAVGLSGKPKGGFFQRLGAYLSGALILLNYKTWLRQGGGALRLASEMTSADHARGIASGLSMTPRQRTERAQRVEAINSYFYERHRRSQAGLFANILGDPRQGQEQFVAAMQSSARSLAMMGNDLAAGKWRQAAKAARESTGAVGKMIRSTDHVLRAIDRQIMLVAFDGYRSGLKKQNPTLSDDQLDVMAAALAEEAFRRTQNVSDPADDTVFAAEQKFDNGYNILLFPFSSDPLKGYNQVQRAIMSKDKKKIAKTVAGVGGNIVMASAVSPLVTGTALVVASMFDGEDDDEEVTRKYLMEQELKYALMGAVGDVAAMGVGYTGLVADAIGSSVLGNPQMADDTLEPLAIRFYGETTKAIAMGNVGEAAAKMSQMAGVPVTAPIQSIAKTVKGVAPDDARLLDYYRALNKENRLNQSQLQRMKILQARERLRKKQESEQ